MLITHLYTMPHRWGFHLQFVISKISLRILKKMAESMFENFVKAVVDVEKGIMVVDAQVHADMEAFLLDEGSDQNNLWGINLYPDQFGDHWIEFDSMINLRPSRGNRSRGIEDSKIRKKIVELVESLVSHD
jgi:hypothetical protein